MQTIDKAIIAQNWIMQYYKQWIPLDACLELIHSIEKDDEEVSHEAELVKRDETIKKLQEVMELAWAALRGVYPVVDAIKEIDKVLAEIAQGE